MPAISGRHARRSRNSLSRRAYEIAKGKVEESYLKIVFGDQIIGRAIIYLKEDADVYDGQEQLGWDKDNQGPQ